MATTTSALRLQQTSLGCCAPVTTAPLSVGAADQLARTLKAIAEPTRLRLLSLIAAHANAEACVCELTGPVGLSQPTVSHHLKVLVDAGLLTREKRGVWAFYTLIPEALGDLAVVLTPATSSRERDGAMAKPAR